MFIVTLIRRFGGSNIARKENLCNANFDSFRERFSNEREKQTKKHTKSCIYTVAIDVLSLLNYKWPAASSTISLLCNCGSLRLNSENLSSSSRKEEESFSYIVIFTSSKCFTYRYTLFMVGTKFYFTHTQTNKHNTLALACAYTTPSLPTHTEWRKRTGVPGKKINNK